MVVCLLRLFVFCSVLYGSFTWAKVWGVEDLGLLTEQRVRELKVGLIMAGSSAADLTYKMERVRLFETLRRSCSWEVEHKKIPVSCYKARHLVLELGGRNKMEGSQQMRLDELCLSRLSDLPEVAFSAHQLSAVTGPCQTAINVKIQDNLYRQLKN